MSIYNHLTSIKEALMASGMIIFFLLILIIFTVGELIHYLLHGKLYSLPNSILFDSDRSD